METLSPSREHYLKAVYRLSEGGDGARITDIAQALGVSKASTCHAVRELQQKELVYRDNRHQVYLSVTGKKVAALVTRNYESLKSFFIEILGIDEEAAAVQACALEHVMSSGSLHSLEGLLKQPARPG